LTICCPITNLCLETPGGFLGMKEGTIEQGWVTAAQRALAVDSYNSEALSVLGTVAAQIAVSSSAWTLPKWLQVVCPLPPRKEEQRVHCEQPIKLVLIS
jgi:inorganic triphosphatase YgiF